MRNPVTAMELIDAAFCAENDPLDLTDEGLLADLEKHGAEGADKLAIGGDHDKQEHSKH